MGPWRSARTVEGRPKRFSSARIAAITATLDAWSPWLMLTRKASAPASNSAAIIAGVLLAGPSVARMRTFRDRGLMALVMMLRPGEWLVRLPV